jgi:hypothetical protein
LKEKDILTITSLLSILLMTLHLADDIVRGYEKGDLYNLTAVLIVCPWLYGTLLLRERRSGYIIVLLASLLSLAVPYLHMRGKGVALSSRVAHSDGAFFFVWTLIALGVTALFSFILCARGLWRLPWRRTR